MSMAGLSAATTRPLRIDGDFWASIRQTRRSERAGSTRLRVEDVLPMTRRSGLDGPVWRLDGLRRSADGAGELPPRGQPRECQRQVQDDPPRRALDPHSELDQSLPQRGDLSVGGRGGPTAQLLKEDVRRQREQDAELVGPELRATGA